MTMKPFQNILVPTDFSSHAEEATRLAADLSRHYAASVALIHVYEPVSYPLPDGYVVFTPTQLERMFKEFDARLAGAKRDAEAAGARNVTTHLLDGFAAAEIRDFAAQNGVDLIVMGRHGKGSVERLLLGSVAEKVVQTAPCPVLSVRSGR